MRAYMLLDGAYSHSVCRCKRCSVGSPRFLAYEKRNVFERNAIVRRCFLYSGGIGVSGSSTEEQYFLTNPLYAIELP